MDFEASRYISWSKDNDSVIVSMALSCPANCKFCYIDSILQKQDELAVEGSLLGKLLAKDVFKDHRFKKGRFGTNILMGGFSDPFYKGNTSASISFITSLVNMSVDNIIHIATKFCASDEKLIDILSSYNNLLVNYSVTSMSGALTMGKYYVKKRFKEAKRLSSLGVLCALYIRPVIPNVTIHDVPEIIKQARISGIQHVTIGRLFFDERILSSLSSSGVKIEDVKIRQNKFILDNKSILSELDCQDVDIIKTMFTEADFKVFLSSSEICTYLKTRIS